MNKMQMDTLKKIGGLPGMPKFEKIKFQATIDDSSYSLEFFVTVDGVQKQCYELADEGVIAETDIDCIFAEIARDIRICSEYKRGDINKFSFQL